MLIVLLYVLLLFCSLAVSVVCLMINLLYVLSVTVVIFVIGGRRLLIIRRSRPLYVFFLLFYFSCDECLVMYCFHCAPFLLFSLWFCERWIDLVLLVWGLYDCCYIYVFCFFFVCFVVFICFYVGVVTIVWRCNCYSLNSILRQYYTLFQYI